MNYQLGKYFCILNLSLYFPWKVRKQRIWLKFGRMLESLASFLKIATFPWLMAVAEFMLLHPVPMTLGSLVAQLVKNLHAWRRPGFDSWVGKSPWRRKWPIHSSTLAWRIPWTEELGRVQSMGSRRVRHNCVTNFVFHLQPIPHPNTTHLPVPTL